MLQGRALTGGGHLVVVPPTAEPGRPVEAPMPVLGVKAMEEALRVIGRCPAHRATPLVALPALAARLGLGGLWVKDEGERFGLQSFKALGGAYAVALAAEEAKAKGGNGALTVCCASDGNHGRSVAYGARHFGALAVVFVHEGVSQARRDAISNLGADLRITQGSYDDAVREAQHTAAAQGWLLLADTSANGDEHRPIDIMRGYTLLIAEACDQAQAGPPFTHVLVQAGVGGLAAAVVDYCFDRYGADGPSVIVVEPVAAACLQASAAAGRLSHVSGDLETVMAMLSCGEPSPIAWTILAGRAAAFVTIEDEDAEAAVRLFAKPLASDPAMRVGESGAAGLGALLALERTPDAFAALSLHTEARVLLIATEAPTDLERYVAILSQGPDDRRPVR